MTALYVILGLLAILLIYGISIFNKFVKLKNMVSEAWSGIDVILKKRHDLIPNLIETVKAYSQHEQDTLQKIVNARNSAIEAKTMEEKESAEKSLSKSLSGINMLAEQYPDLKANENFINLQNELSAIEDELSKSRRYYNATVRDNNIQVDTFPSKVIAGLYNFDKFPFFEIEDANTQELPKVNFS